ncbi:peptidylprolyl isomerase [Candidatus Pelagibacter communis]|uniref:peptidylprolyl isomerase n=1 Tax=Pelagibacter ubique TaxID=198252 RepID=UPI00094CA360|nr:peptidylprolyl isomerase [Candidatus Pelagibacter ubique]
MNFKIKIVIFFLLTLFFNNKIYALENKILFKVDNEIITSIDILNEIQYLSLLNKNLSNLKKENIFEIAKNSIIKEKIKIIELSRYLDKIEVEQKYYKLFLNDYIKNLNVSSLEDFERLILEKGIKIENIQQKIKVELLWNQLIFSKFSKDIKINKEKIKEEILKNNLQNEYLISEIVFNLDKGQQLNTKLNLIKSEIKDNSFSSAALMHSISNSSNNGGRLGWIKLNSLNSKIKNQILKTKVNGITEPIVIPGGFIILKINDVRKTKIVDNIDKEVELVVREVSNKQLNQHSIIYFNKIKKEIEINEF